MNFYLDFEATQFTQRIIAIGCVTEDGSSFYTLVKLTGNDKVSKFITALTGIDNELLQEKGMSPAAALRSLKEFIDEHTTAETNFFYVYGNADKVFLNNTIPRTRFKDNEANWYYSFAASLIDYSSFVNRFFNTDTVSLKKAAAWFKGEGVYQNHNALDDADLLRMVACGINSTKPPIENPWAEEMKERARKQQENNEKNDITSLSDKHAHIRAISVDGTLPTLEFTTYKEAALYTHNNLLDIGQRKNTDPMSFKKKIKHAIRVNKPYFKYNWELIKEEQTNE